GGPPNFPRIRAPDAWHGSCAITSTKAFAASPAGAGARCNVATPSGTHERREPFGNSTGDLAHHEQHSDSSRTQDGCAAVSAGAGRDRPIAVSHGRRLGDG